MSSSVAKYIVVFKDGVTSERISAHLQNLKDNGGKLKERWDLGGILNGFAATIPDSYLSNFRSSIGSEIAYIEADGVVTIQ